VSGQGLPTKSSDSADPGTAGGEKVSRYWLRRIPQRLSYGGCVRVEQHWWNGDVRLARRDVYVRTDGQLWEVEAQMGGKEGKSKVQQCPGKASALILADAWRGSRWQWRQV
jgi:hypothetical protein